MGPVVLTIVVILVAVFLFISIVNRYRRCPSDKVLVVYGTTGNKGSAKCIHGGGTFVWPIIQDYAYLRLYPELSSGPFSRRTRSLCRGP